MTPVNGTLSLMMTLKTVLKINISKLNFKIQVWKHQHFLKTSLNYRFSLFYKYVFLDRLNNQTNTKILQSPLQLSLAVFHLIDFFFPIILQDDI